VIFLCLARDCLAENRGDVATTGGELSPPDIKFVPPPPSTTKTSPGSSFRRPPSSTSGSSSPSAGMHSSTITAELSGGVSKLPVK